jgi:hypothetical protein
MGKSVRLTIIDWADRASRPDARESFKCRTTHFQIADTKGFIWTEAVLYNWPTCQEPRWTLGTSSSRVQATPPAHRLRSARGDTRRQALVRPAPRLPDSWIVDATPAAPDEFQLHDGMAQIDIVVA